MIDSPSSVEVAPSWQAPSACTYTLSVVIRSYCPHLISILGSQLETKLKSPIYISLQFIEFFWSADSMCECLLACFVQSSGQIHRKVMVCISEEGAGAGARPTSDHWLLVSGKYEGVRADRNFKPVLSHRSLLRSSSYLHQIRTCRCQNIQLTGLAGFCVPFRTLRIWWRTKVTFDKQSRARLVLDQVNLILAWIAHGFYLKDMHIFRE